MSKACIVCGVTIDEGREVYSNLWEQALKQHPCCSSRCATAFSVTVHWIPFDPPRRLDQRQAEAAMESGRARLHRGQAPESVVQELLLDGLEPTLVRRTLHGVIADIEAPPEEPASVRNDQHLTLLTGLFGILTAIFAGWFFFVGSSRAWSGGSKADPKLVAKAEDDVDLWEKKFGLRSSRA